MGRESNTFRAFDGMRMENGIVENKELNIKGECTEAAYPSIILSVCAYVDGKR